MHKYYGGKLFSVPAIILWRWRGARPSPARHSLSCSSQASISSLIVIINIIIIIIITIIIIIIVIIIAIINIISTRETGKLFSESYKNAAVMFAR